jgi:hypothetical protein
MKSTKQIMFTFKKTQALWKKYCDEGKCTKEEAIYHILGAAQDALFDCKVTEFDPEPEKNNMYQGNNFN